GGAPAALRPDPAHPGTALPHDSVLALERARDGSVYIGTKRGLYRADAAGRGVRRVPVPGRDPAASTWALLADGDRLWIGGQTDGVWTLDLAHGGGGAVALPLRDRRVVSLARGGGGSLWIGTRSGLACRAGDGTLTPAPALRGAFVSALRRDRRGRLWVGTYGAGVRVFGRDDCAAAAQADPKSLRRELPSVLVNALVEDRGGRFWVSTDSGLATIDPGTWTVRALHGAEGVAFPNYWTGSAALTDAGELLFGGAGGMTIVMPERLHGWTYRPPLVLTAWRIDGRPQPVPAPGAPLRLPARASRVDLEFAALDYSAPGRNRYAYRLEGYDDGWVETDRRDAGYSRLAPGRYRLLLRGSNRAGVWSEPPLALALQVDAAWYQTPAFRAAVGAALVALFWAALQLRTRLLRQRRRELERLVAERTAALEQVSRELERSSLSDPLTGLRNRRFLSAEIESSIAASARRAAAPPGSEATGDTVFLLVDIDHFKQVNDTHGHAAGDAVLVEFARRLLGVTRDHDHVVRWGGEEFLVAVREADRREAPLLAERMRAAVADAPFDAGGVRLPLSCSIGIAAFPVDAADPLACGWTAALDLADARLYEAKRRGRNCCVDAAGPVPALPQRRGDYADSR
ncbi:MAG: diguanylate cyclase, partial [Burkholderiales bacterium]|nr:diguanylate cyclase [Burkholderiales bacterium]